MLCPTNLFGRKGHRRQVDRLGQTIRRSSLFSDQPGGGVVELEPCLLASLIHREQRSAGQAILVPFHPEQAYPVVCATRHQHEVRSMAVEDERLVTVQHPRIATSLSLQGDRFESPSPVILGDRKGSDRLPRCKSGQKVLLR